ncbi:MAG: uncharacterized protein JWQ90_4723 [Hydrocarboniphaga sp.]|uniref:GH36-type glycosyl hydrolase domain-containing protein n=1 Tax=Hydrocarboniphaga sp. TaxID=2033016 RepID=UPI00260CD486|nr:hypothetical protein [Hydrocarboniphaga sp.]MDB5972273.1 uncharacterized protein [Hydrocarboniphaga sp.]
MNQTSAPAAGRILVGHSGMRVELTATGAIRHFDCDGLALALFVGNEIDGSVGNVFLRRLGDRVESTPLLGPSSATRFRIQGPEHAIVGFGEWLGIRYSISLVLSKTAPAWFWHVCLENHNATAQLLDLSYAQDVALAPYGAVRLNEFYVSQYLDHTPLLHPEQGQLIATRQNQAVDGRNPWSLIGSLRSGASFATDALQFHGLAIRSGASPVGLAGDLPSRRLQHEHSLVVIRDATIQLAAGGRIDAGFFGAYWAHHPEATSDADLQRVSEVLSLAEAKPGEIDSGGPVDETSSATLFSTAPLLSTLDLDEAALNASFPAPWRHEESGDSGQLLSFFHGTVRDAGGHVVMPAKELNTLRPHGHLLRTGQHLTPDESALTSTAWMSGVFHSLLTQGHVSINRLLSTMHSYLGLFRTHGQRVFVEIGGCWQLLGIPSAFEISSESCLWIYRHEVGEIRVRSEAHSTPHELRLSIDVVSGPALRCLISHHIALNGDDGSTRGAALWRQEGQDIVITAAKDSDVGRRFPNGSFRIAARAGTRFETIGGDELLFLDGQSRQEPFICIVTTPATSLGLRIRGDLVDEGSEAPLRVGHGEDLIPPLCLHMQATSPLSEPLARLADIAPWLTHNALVHYLSPRGLEQYSGGGWGTRDVCQGPVEMLFALDRVQPIRDLLLRVMRQQNADGDWPQWFMFFERERDIRPGDSHGDIVFWPLLVLGQYLIASGDGDLLDEPVPYFDAGDRGTLWEHMQRALALIERRVIPGTSLAAYGHGDWNDSLQPADPAQRERLCSAWTVTLHVQTLTTLARGLRAVARSEATAAAAALERRVEPVRHDFQKFLVADGVLTGYAHFEDGGQVRQLLHPRDTTTGVRYSALAMVHAILEDLFTPEQTREHLQLLATQLSGPDGLRLFDRPMRYRGGPQQLFQRAESATYFGREIGLMYMHAHLRYAQALAHVGDAEAFFHALCQTNPIGIRSLVPSATLRQANCYYSSSDAAFDDRYQASAEYERVGRGTVPLDGGWRVYSSGAGIALGLILRRFLGLSVEWDRVSIDPVIPPALDGMRVDTRLIGRPLEVRYAVRGSGSGVSKLVLNDRPLPFTSGANPHRRGAALIDRAVLAGRLQEQGNVLNIDVG